MPYALLISVVIAALSLIPIVGAFIGCFIGALLILLVSPIKALIFVAIFLVLQQIEGNLIYPRVVGGSIGLPAIWGAGGCHSWRQCFRHCRYADFYPADIGIVRAAQGMDE